MGQGSTDRAACEAARVSILSIQHSAPDAGSSLACRQRTAQGLPTASPNTDRTLIIETCHRILSPKLVCILTLPPAFSARKASGLASYTRRRWERGLAHQPPYMQVLWKSATCRCSMPHQPHVDGATGVSGHHTRPDPGICSAGDMFCACKHIAESSCNMPVHFLPIITAAGAPGSTRSGRCTVWGAAPCPAGWCQRTSAGPPASRGTARRSASRSGLHEGAV